MTIPPMMPLSDQYLTFVNSISSLMARGIDGISVGCYVGALDELKIQASQQGYYVIEIDDGSTATVRNVLLRKKGTCKSTTITREYMPPIGNSEVGERIYDVAMIAGAILQSVRLWREPIGRIDITFHAATGSEQPTTPEQIPITILRNAPPTTAVEAAIHKAEDIILMIDNMTDEDTVEKATEFFEDVREKVAGVIETIVSTNNVTDRQWAALNGWHNGVVQWMHED